ncbi:MAG: hypothetical protein HWN68_16215 [Desulfobacterales bacterium]|nr:hypothetical protein [Desulfobacterales bacterium]
MTKYQFRFKARGEGWTKIEIDENGVMHLPELSFRNAQTTGDIRRFIELLVHENWTDAEVKEVT